MCGINGILRLERDAPPIDRREVDRVRDAMAKRGPDDAGTWLAPGGEVALANRRLAILDLSPTGHQPMATDDGRHHLVLNGEIYNFRALRRELEGEGVAFRGTGDTEVVLRLLTRHGAAALSRLRGMFALALWDDAEKSLLLARDPLGIKPLYYSRAGGLLRFASQVKALEASAAIDSEIDRQAVAAFLLWGSIPEPLTFRREVRALRAGQTLEARGGELRFGEIAPPPAPSPEEEPEPGEAPHAAALRRTVDCHLESDVPIGVFLSAGLDSSLIAALAARRLRERLTTLTVSFDALVGTPDDEGPLAAETAKALGTRHVERRLGDEDLADLWERGLAAMDQPTIDGFNVFAVSEVAASEGFKVVLSGLGGDELFGSYDSFRDVPRWARVGRIGSAIPGLPALWRRLAPRARRPKLPGLFTWARELPGAYLLRRGLFLPEELPSLLGVETAHQALAGYDPLSEARAVLARAVPSAGVDPWLAVHHLETRLYMRNQLLRDADWASMAHSVELRVPLVDAWLERDLASLGFEPGRTEGKAAAVRSAATELPAGLFARAKSGFFAPIEAGVDASVSSQRPSDHQTKGLRSRRIALGVLRAFGVEVALPG
ncbi:MAG TPA: asparagine synthase (glutamine-hydrolyzing) [Thermoanaerobaculia bacterium]|nr:asparagine synthase (glutamine-hydrolyzing) [Thermoanaerobaculia bacterium]